MSPLIEIERERAICERHGEYEKLRLSQLFDVWTGCPQCAELELAANLEIDGAAPSAPVPNAEIVRAGVPRIYADIKLEAFRPTCERARHTHQRLTSFVENFDKCLEVGAWILLHGPSGSGKTLLGALVTSSLLQARRNVLMLSQDDLLARMNRDERANHGDFWSAFVEPDLLVIDEVSQRSLPDWISRRIFTVLNKRYEQCRPVLLLSPHDTGAALEARIAERFQRAAGVQLSLV